MRSFDVGRGRSAPILLLLTWSYKRRAEKPSPWLQSSCREQLSKLSSFPRFTGNKSNGKSRMLA